MIEPSPPDDEASGHALGGLESGGRDITLDKLHTPGSRTGGRASRKPSVESAEGSDSSKLTQPLRQSADRDASAHGAEAVGEGAVAGDGGQGGCSRSVSFNEGGGDLRSAKISQGGDAESPEKGGMKETRVSRLVRLGTILNADEDLKHLDEIVREDKAQMQDVKSRHEQMHKVSPMVRRNSTIVTSGQRRAEVERLEKELEEERANAMSPSTQRVELPETAGDGFETKPIAHTHLDKDKLFFAEGGGHRHQVDLPFELDRQPTKHHLATDEDLANDGFKRMPSLTTALKAPPGAQRKGAPLFKKLSQLHLDEVCREFRAVVATILEIQDSDGGWSTEGEPLSHSDDAEKMHVAGLAFAVFRHFSKGEHEVDKEKKTNSMDIHEFVACMESTHLMPIALSKKAAISLFKEANKAGGSDYDAHEMSQFEFLRALEILVKRVGIGELAALLLSPEERQRFSSRPVTAKSGGSGEVAHDVAIASLGSLGDISNLGNLKLEHMKSLLRLFQKFSLETASEPQLPMEVFVSAFSPVLNVTSQEIEMLFMKIDVNSDGIVTWNEFSSFVLDMSEKGGAVVHGDTVFDGIRMEEKDEDLHHEDSIHLIHVVPRFGTMVSIGADGAIKAWHAATGAAITKNAGKLTRAAPADKTIMTMTVLVNSSMLAVGADDFKIRFFDCQTLRQDLSYDTAGKWPMCATAFWFPEDIMDSSNLEGGKRELAPWFAWADNDGQVHFVPEQELVNMRTHLEVVPFFRSNLRGCWDLRVFRVDDVNVSVPWCTEMVFVQDVGVNGAMVVASSSGAIGVVSVEGREVLHYFHQHHLSVKALEWCGRQNNLLASAGLDRDIHLWRPVHIKHGKAIYTGALTGHKARVTGLAFHEARDVLFSLDSHSIVLVWDLASRTLVCRLNPLSQNPFDINHKVEAIIINNVSRHLITATNHPRMWGVRALDLRDDRDKLLAHSKGIVRCLYNSEFNHLLSADVSGFISLWQLETGKQFFKFMCEEVEATNTMPEVTSLAFDESQRRLLVGWSQGSLQVYNFSNGTLLNHLLGDTTSSVTAITHAAYTKGRGDHRRLLLAAYDDGVILQWPSKLSQKDVMPVRRLETPSWMGADRIDVSVMAMAFTWPMHTLLVARQDGMAMLWDIQTGFLRKGHDGQMLLPVTQKRGIVDDLGHQVPPAIRAVKFLHKASRVCVIADEGGFIHFIDTGAGEMVGTIKAPNFGGASNEPWRKGVVDGISAIEVDRTDSFLFAGDCNGYINVWDISQIISPDGDLDVSMCIQLFKWKAHRHEVAWIEHIASPSLIFTSSKEKRLQLMLWTVTGTKIGILGHTKWDSSELTEKVQQAEEDFRNGVGVNNSGGDTSTRSLLSAGKKKKSLTRMVENKFEKIHKVVAGFQAARLMNRLAGSSNRMGTATSISSNDASGIEGSTKPKKNEEDNDTSKTRGQLTILIRDVRGIPFVDRRSKVDPYCCVKLQAHPERRTRVHVNSLDPLYNERFLYFIDDMQDHLTIEVWHKDQHSEENDRFMGQVAGSLASFLLGGLTSQQLTLPLVLKAGDENTTGKSLGHITFSIQLEPIASQLGTDNRSLTLQDTIRSVLNKHRTDALLLHSTTSRSVIAREHTHGVSNPRSEDAFVVPVSKTLGEGYDRVTEVTSLATARWGTSDFRNLAVYRLQDDKILSQRVSGAQTERGPRRRKDMPDPTVLHPPRSARGTGDGKLLKDTFVSKLERSLDIAASWGDPVQMPVPPSARSRLGGGSFQNKISHSPPRKGLTDMPKLKLEGVVGPGRGQLNVTKLTHIGRKAEEEQKAAEKEIRNMRRARGFAVRSPTGQAENEGTARMIGGAGGTLPLLRREFKDTTQARGGGARRR